MSDALAGDGDLRRRGHREAQHLADACHLLGVGAVHPAAAADERAAKAAAGARAAHAASPDRTAGPARLQLADGVGAQFLVENPRALQVDRPPVSGRNARHERGRQDGRGGPGEESSRGNERRRRAPCHEKSFIQPFYGTGFRRMRRSGPSTIVNSGGTTKSCGDGSPREMPVSRYTRSPTRGSANRMSTGTCSSARHPSLGDDLDRPSRCRHRPAGIVTVVRVPSASSPSMIFVPSDSRRRRRTSSFAAGRIYPIHRLPGHTIRGAGRRSIAAFAAPSSPPGRAHSVRPPRHHRS